MDAQDKALLVQFMCAALTGLLARGSEDMEGDMAELALNYAHDALQAYKSGSDKERVKACVKGLLNMSHNQKDFAPRRELIHDSIISLRIDLEKGKPIQEWWLAPELNEPSNKPE